MKVARQVIGVAVLVMAQVICVQAQAPPAALAVGENTKMNASALFTGGYTGDYGDAVPSNHGLDFGVDGKLNGYYYTPNFLSFTATPYYNQSRNDSSYQSLTGASGIDGTANFFAGSHFPGSVNYRYDRNSTGTFGLVGQPNFTTVGKGQGFGINWSALLPDWPTLAIGYSQGSGSGTIYGTSEETQSDTKLFNAHSNYQIAGFRLNAFYDHNTLNSKYPEFLSGQQDSVQDTSGQNIGFGAQHSLPLHGTFYANFNRASADSNYFYNQGSSNSNYVDDSLNSGASFRVNEKLSLNLTENYTSNLSGYLTESLGQGGVQPVSLGSGAHSIMLGGGASYQFTNHLSSTAQATHYDQYYFGQDYTGTFLSGTLNYGKRLLNMFTFSGTVIESSTGMGSNAVGFIGNANYFHKVMGWETSGQFSYAQNVQTLLITYTTSYYNYSGNLNRRLLGGWHWSAGFNGSHSGLTNYSGTTNSSEGFSTSLGNRRFTAQGLFSKSTGISLLGGGTLLGVPPTPGVNQFVTYNGSSYGGGFTVTPLRKLVLSGAYSRAISNTLSDTISHNNTEIYNAQMQYHLRRIGLQAGYTRFTQGISAVGAPQSTTTYFVGFSRWFDFF
jgi:hypothetical protein